MTLSTTHSRTGIIAEPLADHTWRVCDSEAIDLIDETMGYIGELGGTYEVRMLHAPELRQYVPSSKEAMECFEAVAS